MKIKLKVGRATENVNDPTLNSWFQQFVRARGAYLYKQKYDFAYLAQQYKGVHHRSFSFRHKRPTVAVSALYWLEILKPDETQVPWIAFNVYPTKDETHVIFSFLESDEEYVNSEIDNIFNVSIKRRLWLLSGKIISTTENFVISPTFWNGLSEKKRHAIVTHYRDTLFYNQAFSGKIRDLCLFELSNKN